MNRHSLEILEHYVFDWRTEFYKYKETEALFINYRGNRLQGMSFANRLKGIIEATENKAGARVRLRGTRETTQQAQSMIHDVVNKRLHVIDMKSCTIHVNPESIRDIIGRGGRGIR